VADAKPVRRSKARSAPPPAAAPAQHPTSKSAAGDATAAPVPVLLGYFLLGCAVVVLLLGVMGVTVLGGPQSSDAPLSSDTPLGKEDAVIEDGLMADADPFERVAG
jgi:hypothetical protein